MRYQVRSGLRSCIGGEGEIVLGRSAYCSLVIDHNSVSRVHARIYKADGVLELSDLGSRHGTFVNGRRITAPVRITPDDDIRVGEQPVTVEVVSTRRSCETVADRGAGERDDTSVSRVELS